MKWIKKGFKEFQKGWYGNGGQNLYTSANGTLQRIFNFDINGDGYFDLPIANSHSMWERPPVYVYDTKDSQTPLSLPSNGSFNAIMTDLTGNGTDDLVIACQHDGVHTDTSAIIYFGSEIGLSEKYCMELRAPNSLGVAAGDFNGSGKKALAFLSGSKTRIFYPTELGIEASIYTDLDIAGISIAAGDLDGDGYDDLYIMHQTTGHLSVYWGGPDEINESRCTKLPTRGPHGMCTVDIGNIMNRTDSEFYTSEVYETPLKATKVCWIAENGKKTWVKIQFRCADTLEALDKEEWSESFENGADISALNLTGYIQYKLELGAKCACGTPRVTEVTVDFE